MSSRRLWVLALVFLLLAMVVALGTWLKREAPEQQMKAAPSPASRGVEAAPESKVKADTAGVGRPESTRSWAPLCSQYCQKLKACGVKADDACADTCVTLLSSGVEAKPYECVRTKACRTISDCGI